MRMKNKSLLFLLHPDYYNGHSTPYNYYLRFSKKTNFKKLSHECLCIWMTIVNRGIQ